MSRLFMVLFAILALFSIGILGSHSCGENEVWSDCGTACPPTCKNPRPDVCVQKCVVGCQCRKGLVRSKSGKCIPPSHCK